MDCSSSFRLNVHKISLHVNHVSLLHLLIIVIYTLEINSKMIKTLKLFKISILVCVILYPSQLLYAQKLNKKISGTWLNVDTIEYQQDGSKEVLYTLIVFEKGERFTINRYQKQKSQEKTCGYFLLSDNDSILLINSSNEGLFYRRQKINTINDSILILNIEEGNINNLFSYKRIKLKPEEFNEICCSNSSTLYLVNSLDTNKTVKLNTGEVKLKLIMPHDSTIELHDKSYDIDDVSLIKNDSNLVFQLHREREEYSSKSGLYFLKTSEYGFNPDSINDELYKSLNIQQIETINFTPNYKANLNSFCSFIAVASFTTAFLVAPLISIDYKGGPFKQGRYFQTLAWCGVGFTFAIPFMIISPSYYKATKKGKKVDNEFWYLENRN